MTVITSILIGIVALILFAIFMTGWIKLLNSEKWWLLGVAPIVIGIIFVCYSLGSAILEGLL